MIGQTSHYSTPDHWVIYEFSAIASALIKAKTAAATLNRLPYLPQWIEQAHEEQLRLEAAGTTLIEGAVFSEREKEEALSANAEMSSVFNHSQRQLRAADATYRWIREQPAARKIDARFVFEFHHQLVTGCDDDHCEPGALRRTGAEATFGIPRCRGARGGGELANAFDGLMTAFAGEFRRHDRIVQAMAAHYHLGAMHPFGDGNGRTARALESFMLRAAGVNEMVMVSLSNYYYEHENSYFKSLDESRKQGHNLTPFLMFALDAVESRCNALADEIVINNKRILYREFARSLFGRLQSPRRRAIVIRQLHIIDVLLGSDSMEPDELLLKVWMHYDGLKHKIRAFVRDLSGLLNQFAIVYRDNQLSVDLDWPLKTAGSDRMQQYEQMPAAATSAFPSMAELSKLLGRNR